jgi:carboxypeptidase Taq
MQGPLPTPADGARGPDRNAGALAELARRCAEISDLGRARALLAWDERTMMPRAGAGGRAEQIATLARVRHERLTDERLWELLEELTPWAAEQRGELPGPALVRMARRDSERARRVPADLRAELARAGSIGETAWAEARSSGELAGYLPVLARNVELRREYAACLAPDAPAYDALLDDFEPGADTASVSAVLERLREGLVPLVERIVPAAERAAREPNVLLGRFPAARQRALLERVLGELPLPEDSWRLDSTLHPFAASIAHGDIRLTTRFAEEDLGFALFSALHEAGHGLYESGVPPELRRGPLGRPASLGFHESQSRLWENQIGRSGAFLGRLLGPLREVFGAEFEEVGPDRLLRDANRVALSPIRVEADEVTYNLHILLRFELELELFERGLDPSELPAAWRERSRQLLGFEPADDREGVLQDVHWAAGSFGYFPTYALGNVIAAQLWEALGAELGDPEELIAAGELTAIHAWLGERVHRHGGIHPPAELARRALGGELDPDPLLRYLERKFGGLFGA